MQARILYKTSFVGILLICRTLCAAEPTSAATNTTDFRFGDVTRILKAKAVQAGDAEVGAAAEYNLLHLEAVSTNVNEVGAALEKLAAHGDEFTLTWLEKHSSRTPARDWIALAQKAREQIRLCLQTAPNAPQKLVQPRLFQAAVADLTCNALEVEIKGFAWGWARRQATNDTVRAELQRLARPSAAANAAFTPEAVRERAAEYAERLLRPSPPPSK